MPLKLNVGLSKKIGQPDYGSLGASCNVELELESSLIQSDPGAFQRHVRNAFVACRQAVQEELSREQQSAAGNGHPQNGNGNGRQAGHSRSANRQATASQVRAIHAIACRQQLDLTAELRNRFGVTSPAELGIGEASELIDSLKSVATANGTDR